MFNVWIQTTIKDGCSKKCHPCLYVYLECVLKWHHDHFKCGCSSLHHVARCSYWFVISDKCILKSKQYCSSLWHILSAFITCCDLVLSFSFRIFFFFFFLFKASWNRGNTFWTSCTALTKRSGKYHSFLNFVTELTCFSSSAWCTQGNEMQVLIVPLWTNTLTSILQWGAI